MDYQTFKEIVIERLLMCQPEGAWAEDVEMANGNRRIYSGISIIHPSKYMSPVFYLEPFFKMACDGVRMGQIVTDILMVLKAAESMESDKTAENLNWENIRDKVYPRLVNYKKNQKLLSGAPHKKFLDLAVVYYVEIPMQGRISGYMTVRMPLFEMWGIGLQELHKAALYNLQHQVIPNMISAYELRKISEPNYIGGTDGKPDKIHGIMRQEPVDENQDISDSEETEKLKKEYILSMSKFTYGAEVLLCTDVIEELSRKLQADLYIIPLAVDAVQAVPLGKWISQEEIYEEIGTVESMKPESPDFLSNFLYRYKAHEFKLISRK